MLFRALLLSGLLASAGIAALAQEPVKLDPDAVAQLLTRRVPPVYPPIAKAARIQGTVVFDVVIGPDGKLASMKVVSGPAMLQQAAIDALKQWTFQPFLQSGTAVTAAGRISIEFSLGMSAEAAKKDEEIAQRYFEVQDECHKALAKQDNSPETGAACKKDADIADEFAPDARFIEKRSSFVYAAWALADCHDFKTALVYANKAVTVVELGHDDNSGSSAAYGIRGIVEGDLNDLPSADRDLTTAEEFGRKALDWAKKENFEDTDSYVNSQRLYLRLHSALLLALNRPGEARKKLEEMETLK
ncbi:MAG: energy transducer TonB [Terracidiphilus sp.]